MIDWPSPRVYARHARASDRGRWSVHDDVPWQSLDVHAARARPELLDHLRLAALIEAYHPVNLGRLMLDSWDDVDAGVERDPAGKIRLDHIEERRSPHRARHRGGPTAAPRATRGVHALRAPRRLLLSADR